MYNILYIYIHVLLSRYVMYVYSEFFYLVFHYLYFFSNYRRRSIDLRARLTALYSSLEEWTKKKHCVFCICSSNNALTSECMCSGFTVRSTGGIPYKFVVDRPRRSSVFIFFTDSRTLLFYSVTIAFFVFFFINLIRIYVCKFTRLGTV